MQNKMPLGLKIILAFSIFGILSALWTITQGTYQFNIVIPKGIKGLGEIINYTYWATQFAWIISVFKKYKWGWKLFIATNLLVAGNVILGEIIQGFNLASIAVYLTLILMAVMSVYVYKVRAYFSR